MSVEDYRNRTLTCPLCANTEFDTQESREESRWGFTSHRMTLKVCTRCSYVMHFYDAHSWFDVQ
jgi:predicted nucleic-acid-binding Zn-ribbon protein